MASSRRQFLAAFGAAAAWPIAARSQPMPLIGFLSAGSLDDPSTAALLAGLAESGLVKGRDFEIEYRTAEGKFDRLPALAADLISRRAAVLVTGGSTSALAAKRATTTIPIVFLGADDPVRFGLVASLSHPGGNATGLNLLTSELTTKRLELLRELAPSTMIVGVLVNPGSPESEPQLKDVQSAADAMGQKIQILSASSESEIDSAFAMLATSPNAALLITNDALFDGRRNRITDLAAAHAIPAVYDRRAYVEVGGLISYGTHYLDGYRRLGSYAAKILRGAKPADLPVEQSTRFELVINAKAAKALRLEIPAKLLALADDVIE